MQECDANWKYLIIQILVKKEREISSFKNSFSRFHEMQKSRKEVYSEMREVRIKWKRVKLSFAAKGENGYHFDTFMRMRIAMLYSIAFSMHMHAKRLMERIEFPQLPNRWQTTRNHEQFYASFGIVGLILPLSLATAIGWEID